MATRLQLHDELTRLLGNSNVYYQPPETVKMAYPAIKYSISNIKGRFADNVTYSQLRSYEIIVIDRKPDNPVIDELLALPYCSFSRNYKADGLNHDVFTLYF